MELESLNIGAVVYYIMKVHSPIKYEERIIDGETWSRQIVEDKYSIFKLSLLLIRHISFEGNQSYLEELDYFPEKTYVFRNVETKENVVFYKNDSPEFYATKEDALDALKELNGV